MSKIEEIVKKIPGAPLAVRYVRRNAGRLFGRLLSLRRDFVPQVIVMVDGGLGSQMGQYALGLGVQRDCGLPVKYDLSWFGKYGKDINGIYNRNFDLLDVFAGRFGFPVANDREVALYKNFFYYSLKNFCTYDPNVYGSRAPRYLAGYYCNIAYIKPMKKKLTELFQPTKRFSDYNMEMTRVIGGTKNSVMIHVRRGDYVGSASDVTTPDYFRRGVSLLEQKLSSPTFFVFSNDMQYSKELFSSRGSNFIFVDKNDNDSGYADMHLMRQCENFIISNSSFSWWPAFLSDNENKTVIVPDRWWSRSGTPKELLHGDEALVDEDWIRLPCV